MLKLSSISSNSHHSLQRLSMIVRSTESGMLKTAMENGIYDSSKECRGNDESSASLEPPTKRIKSGPIEPSTVGVSESGEIAIFVQPKDPTSCAAEPKKNSELQSLADQRAHIEDTAEHAVKSENAEPSVVSSLSHDTNASATHATQHSMEQRVATAQQLGPHQIDKHMSSQSLNAKDSLSSREPRQKATKMIHLRAKYLGELEYMLREFRKLERQLLGAKGTAQLEESAGSRERREKLHHFILHLDDTVRQIEEGCALEDGHVIPTSEAGTAENQVSKIGSQDPTKEDDDSVQKLEEHILANLLPVKIRLKKQLAAQQGATRNPPGMPAPRRGSLHPSSAALGKGTFAAAAQERIRQAEAARAAQEEQALRRVSDPSQFGKPLGGGGSSLTQKLHGTTLGSKERVHGHGVGSPSDPVVNGEMSQDRKILYAGMAPLSKQHKSSLNAASGVHDLVIEEPNFMQSTSDFGESDVPSEKCLPVSSSLSAVADAEARENSNLMSPIPSTKEPSSTVPPLTNESAEKSRKPHEDLTLSEEERRKLRKKRRKRKLQKMAKRREKERQMQLVLHQQAQAAQAAGNAKASAGRKKPAVPKPQGKKKGPKSVEYMCALCSEAYASTCDYNPWWALAQHECPKCRKTQIPRVDISAPANAIEYHPALLAHAEENGGAGTTSSIAGSNVHVVHVSQPAPAFNSAPKEFLSLEEMESDSDSDLSELSDCSLSEDSPSSDDDSLDFQSMSQAEQAEYECFGEEYDGPVLAEEDASRLLVLMSHASTCPCQHKLTKHREVCRSTKYLMLHVRDCPGTTASFDICPFPWCRKVKHLLYHLVSCIDPDNCQICSPSNLSESLKGLAGLNSYRLKKHRQRLIAEMKSANSMKGKAGSFGLGRCATPKSPLRNTSESAKVGGKSDVGGAKPKVTQSRQFPLVASPTKPKATLATKPTTAVTTIPVHMPPSTFETKTAALLTSNSNTPASDGESAKAGPVHPASSSTMHAENSLATSPTLPSTETMNLSSTTPTEASNRSAVEYGLPADQSPSNMAEKVAQVASDTTLAGSQLVVPPGGTDAGELKIPENRSNSTDTKAVLAIAPDLAPTQTSQTVDAAKAMGVSITSQPLASDATTAAMQLVRRDYGSNDGCKIVCAADGVHDVYSCHSNTIEGVNPSIADSPAVTSPIEATNPDLFTLVKMEELSDVDSSAQEFIAPATIAVANINSMCPAVHIEQNQEEQDSAAVGKPTSLPSVPLHLEEEKKDSVIDEMVVGAFLKIEDSQLLEVVLDKSSAIPGGSSAKEAVASAQDASTPTQSSFSCPTGNAPRCKRDLQGSSPVSMEVEAIKTASFHGDEKGADKAIVEGKHVQPSSERVTVSC